MRYYVAFEKTDTGWSAYVPDLPGVGVTGEVRELVRGAIAMHIKGMRDDGEPIPELMGELIEVT